MISGRGLGHTGGTLDKLESIPGFKTDLDHRRFRSILARTGMVLAGQSDALAPADRKLYALRDASGTVASIPLIASSIMSKKLAEGLDSLVLDVKFGKGAFMTDIEDSRRLAETMVGIGTSHGVATIALLTEMNTPLGYEIGNANEIRESLAVLRGEGPEDLTTLTMALGAEMLIASGISPDPTDAGARLRAAVESGRAMEKFGQAIAEQDGDPRVIEDETLLPSAGRYEDVTSPEDGYIGACDARTVGVAAMRLGAGRTRKEDTIDPGVGITLLAKPGDAVSQGDVDCPHRVSTPSEARRGGPHPSRTHGRSPKPPPSRPIWSLIGSPPRSPDSLQSPEDLTPTDGVRLTVAGTITRFCYRPFGR